MQLAVGQVAKIKGYAKQANLYYRTKLLAMGLTPGTLFKVTRVAPLGDPIQIHVRGYDLSLRRKECSTLLIEPSKS